MKRYPVTPDNPGTKDVQWHNALVDVLESITADLTDIEKGKYGMCGEVLICYYRERDAAALIRQAIFGLRRQIDEAPSEWD